MTATADELPYAEPRIDDEHDRAWWGEKVVLVRCHYSGREPKEDTYGRKTPGKGKCQFCDGVFDLDGDVLSEHARRLPVKEQATHLLEQVARLLDLDPWGKAVLAARSAAGEGSEECLDLRLAAGLGHLQTALVKRGAQAEAARAFTGLLDLKVGDEMEYDLTDSEHYSEGDEDAPLLSEAFLYPLLGKEAARTVLSHVRKVETNLAAGRTREE